MIKVIREEREGRRLTGDANEEDMGARLYEVLRNSLSILHLSFGVVESHWKILGRRVTCSKVTLVYLYLAKRLKTGRRRNRDN
jgi:hypothetical protein